MPQHFLCNRIGEWSCSNLFYSPHINTTTRKAHAWQVREDVIYFPRRAIVWDEKFGFLVTFNISKKCPFLGYGNLLLMSRTEFRSVKEYQFLSLTLIATIVCVMERSHWRQHDALEKLSQYRLNPSHIGWALDFISDSSASHSRHWAGKEIRWKVEFGTVW